ncbi:hypothetical protein [Micromonospora sp. NPDC047730]|uniref:hypothetical protein n=1 Tax=Micromonospora sp. NPDC047730 TaxID=3364253 RepID=UPI0037130219
MIFGRARFGGWVRWLPLYASPMFEDRRRPWRTARGVAVGTFGRVVYAYAAPREETAAGCVPDDCYEVAHHEYRTWPVRLPTPHAFRRGTWPRGGTRANRAWMYLRGWGLIRLYHL